MQRPRFHPFGGVVVETLISLTRNCNFGEGSPATGDRDAPVTEERLDLKSVSPARCACEDSRFLAHGAVFGVLFSCPCNSDKKRQTSEKTKGIARRFLWLLLRSVSASAVWPRLRKAAANYLRVRSKYGGGLQSWFATSGAFSGMCSGSDSRLHEVDPACTEPRRTLL
jgi:hypothetical protein